MWNKNLLRVVNDRAQTNGAQNPQRLGRKNLIVLQQQQ